MISNKTVLEQEYKGKKYRFECDVDAALADVHDVISNFKTFIVGKISEIQSAQKPQPDVPAVATNESQSEDPKCP